MLKNFELDFGFDVDNSNYKLGKFALIFNLTMIIILLFFSFINFLIKSNIFLGFLEILVATTLIISVLLYKKYKKIKVFLLTTSLLVFTLCLIIYFYNKEIKFSFIWLLFFPMTTFLLNGLKIGKILSTIYILIVSINLFLNTDINKNIDIINFLNISIGLIAISMLAYVSEYSRKEAFVKMNTSIKQLEKISHLDELTKLYNRHFLNNKILENKNLQNKPLLFCITDIDNFKAYNDYYGHQQGDKALRQIADTKKSTIGNNKNHFVVRLGGEEFGGFIFDVTNPEEYLNNFIKKLKKSSIEHKKNDSFDICTVSIGAVYCKNYDKSNFSKIYKIADNALYEAKKKGKNQIVYKTI